MVALGRETILPKQRKHSAGTKTLLVVICPFNMVLSK